MELSTELMMKLNSSDMPVGDRIRLIRQAAGIKQNELAAMLGLQYQSISQYERGDRQPKIDMLFRISKALGVSLVYLLPLEYSVIWDEALLTGMKERQRALEDQGYTFSGKEQCVVEDFNRLNDSAQHTVIDFIEQLLDDPEKNLRVSDCSLE